MWNKIKDRITLSWLWINIGDLVWRVFHKEKKVTQKEMDFLRRNYNSWEGSNYGDFENDKGIQRHDGRERIVSDHWPLIDEPGSILPENAYPQTGFHSNEGNSIEDVLAACEPLLFFWTGGSEPDEPIIFMEGKQYTPEELKKELKIKNK